MLITQVKLKKGTAERVCWVRCRRGPPKKGQFVRMPDNEVWTIAEVYETREKDTVHNDRSKRRRVQRRKRRDNL